MGIVYRMQDSQGRGPWKPGFSHKWVIEREDHKNLFPWMDEFKHVDFMYGEIGGCGCRTLDQLRRWFTKAEYKKLLKFGYGVVELKADRMIAESEIQCVFGRSRPLYENAKKVRLYK